MVGLGCKHMWLLTYKISKSPNLSALLAFACMSPRTLMSSCLNYNSLFPFTAIHLFPRAGLGFLHLSTPLPNAKHASSRAAHAVTMNPGSVRTYSHLTTSVNLSSLIGNNVISLLHRGFVTVKLIHTPKRLEHQCVLSFLPNIRPFLYPRWPCFPLCLVSASSALTCLPQAEVMFSKCGSFHYSSFLSS